MTGNRLAALWAAFLLAGAAHASPLGDLLGGDAECVKMADVRAAAKIETPLNDRQFDFVRGMWMIVPPVSSELPIGDKAELVSDGENSGIVMIDSEAGLVCARMHIRDISGFVAVLGDVGTGKTVKAKDNAGTGL